MSAEDLSLNGKITRTGQMNQKQPRVILKQVYQKRSVAIKREIVKLMSLSGYFISEEKINISRSHSSEKYKE